MKALLIQHAWLEGPGLLGVILKARGWQIQSILMERSGARLPDSLHGYDAMVILGGSMGAYEEERFPYLAVVQELIRQALLHEIPTLGICLGAQLIARALGAAVFPNHVQEIGWYPLRLTENGLKEGLFRGLPQDFDVFQWHADTFDLPAGARLLATGETCLNQAFVAGKHMWALQFHPEVNPHMIEQWTTDMPDRPEEFRLNTGKMVPLAHTRHYRQYNEDIQQILLTNIEALLSQRAGMPARYSENI